MENENLWFEVVMKHDTYIGQHSDWMDAREYAEWFYEDKALSVSDYFDEDD